MSLVTSRKKSEDGPVVPDSTSETSDFSNGEDVLLQQKDGRYYLGTVIEVNLVSAKCRVKFGDNTEKWSSFKDLMKLSPKSDILCVICKKSQPKSENEVMECDKCGRGYHQLCHEPHIRKQCNDLEWLCNRCSPALPNKVKEPVTVKRIPVASKKEQKPLNSKKILTKPRLEIELLHDDDQFNSSDDELTCDLSELVSTQDGRCYCGRSGSWIKKMLHCGRCKQWFHEQCIQCLTYPLYYGDRFYVFVCRLCNYGKEFVRRFEMNWVDIMHLTLYNITLYYKRKYYDIDSVIVPYINSNWESFQLPPKIFHVTPQKRKEIILSVLTNNRNRFKCGREIKKRTTIWGLREDIPPPAPVFKLPIQKQPISDAVLKESWSGQDRLRFLPPTLSSLASGKCHLDKGLRNNEGSSNGSSAGTTSPSMIGARTYTNGLSSSSETESLKMARISLALSTEKVCIKSSQFYSRGFVKKSTPFLTESRQTLQEALIRQRWKSMEGGTKSLNRRKKGKQARGTVKEFTARKVRKLVKKARTRQTKKPLQELPPTPSPSSAADTPQPSGPGSQHPLTTPGDTSGDDNSSRCTLDSFIPPPKDFEGKNHPFRSIAELFTLPNGLNVSASLFSSSTTVVNTSPITLPLPLTPVVPHPPPPARPTKRQLCEKDIRIDRNGDVKRRRLRRTRSSSAVPVTPDKPAPAAEGWGAVPVRALRSMHATPSPSPSGSATDYVLNGRRLRASPRMDKKPAPSPPPKSSPVKQNSVKIPLDDLKSSLNSYFGAANRIAAGEKYLIRAKRVTPAGKVHYLIQWEGPST